MGLTSQPFQHMINERKGVMIFPSGMVEVSVVNANSGWNELILLVDSTVTLDFFGTTCTRLTHLLSEMG